VLVLPKTLICGADIGHFLLFGTTETIAASLLIHGDFESTSRQIFATLFPEGDAALFQQLSEEASRFFGNEVQN
jgi:hypothetical protein